MADVDLEDEDSEDKKAKYIQEPSWQELRWKEIRGWIIVVVVVGFLGLPIGDDIRNWFSPVHPAPVSIEADGKSYIACETPDIGRGLFHSTYYADFKDNNGSTVSLRGIEKLIVTNLPKMVNSPMPVFRFLPYPLPDVNGLDKDGKPYQEGFIYTWADGSAAMFKNHLWVSVPGLPEIRPGMEGQIVAFKEDQYRVLTAGKAQVRNGEWAPVKIKNTVCNPDDGRTN